MMNFYILVVVDYIGYAKFEKQLIMNDHFTFDNLLKVKHQITKIAKIKFSTYIIVYDIFS